jgi:transcriptional regulator with XRE-family HTH domain
MFLMRKERTLVELGKRIQEARLELGISQEALATQAGLHRTYMGMVERGERNITIINLLRIATALGIEAGILLQGLRVKPKDVS